MSEKRSRLEICLDALGDDPVVIDYGGHVYFVNREALDGEPVPPAPARAVKDIS